MKKEKKIRKKIQKILPVPIYVFVDSEQKAEFKAKIKPCSHQPNCMKFFIIVLFILYFPQNKMNLFILSGHAGDSFAAFLNEVIL